MAGTTASSRSFIEETIENHFAGWPRVFRDPEELVRALGCTVGPQPDFEDRAATRVMHKNTVGLPPNPDGARLTKGNHILGSEIPSILHEAIHAFCGPETLEEEGLMMAFEVALYALLEKSADRKMMFRFFSESFYSPDPTNYFCREIADALREHGEFHQVWRALLCCGDPKWMTQQGTIREEVLDLMKKNAEGIVSV